MQNRLLEISGELYELAFDAILAIRLDGTIEVWNRGAEQTYGWTKAEAAGGNSHRLLQTQFPKPLPEIEAELIARGRWEGELKHTTREGEQIIVSSRWALVRDTDGKPVGFLEINRDITARKRVEEERERQVRLALAIGEALAKNDPLEEELAACCQALVSELNLAFARIWILNPEKQMLELQASAGQYTHLNGPHSRIAVGKFKIGRIAETGQPQFTNDLQNSDDVSDPEWARREKLASFAGYPLAIGERMLGVVAMFSREALSPATFDVLSSVAVLISHGIERSRIEAALRDSEKRFRALIEHSGDGFVLLDDKAKVLYTGPPVLGYAQGEHRHQEVLALIHPEDREQVGKLFAELTKQPGQTKTAVFRALNKTGSWRWIEAVIQNLLHEPSVAGVVANYRDITERRQLEDQFRQAQKLESLGVLAGGVAHDFNNLLTGILGNATLAADTLSSQHPARPMLRDVIAASESAAHLTRQLLAYSGKGRFFVEPINLSDLVRQIGGLVQASIPKTVQLWLDLAERLPMIQADSGQIQQLVMNLVINGAEAIPQGQTGTVTLTTSVQDIDQSYIRTSFGPDEISPGEYVVVEVRDTGTGMDIQTISKIFDPFFTTKFTGRGLGLAAVQGIVRAHHGALKVYSSPGKGTSFKVVFPSIAAPAANQEPDRKPERRARELRGSGTILVIDDEQIVRRVAKSVLESFGYTVLLAENGLEGSQLFRSSPDGIALVLLDMTMPVMSGEETLRELRSIRPDIKIILSSGYNEVDAVQRFAGKALAGFIQKPYSAVALAEKVTTILGASE